MSNNTASAGEWHVDFLEEADKLPAERYVDTFGATTDWGSPSNGYYTRTVTAATHVMGATPSVKVRAGAAPCADVIIDISVAANGDVSIQVPQTPDLRFAGQTLIM